MLKERRREPRRPTSILGLITFDSGKSTAPCKIANLSASGALIKVGAPGEIPDQLSLYYDDPDVALQVVAAWCFVVRRGAREIAVQFLHDSIMQQAQTAS